MEECRLKYCGYNHDGECTKEHQRESCIEQSLAILRLEEWELELLIRLVKNKLLNSSMHLFMQQDYISQLESLIEKLREGQKVCRHQKS